MLHILYILLNPNKFKLEASIKRAILKFKSDILWNTTVFKQILLISRRYKLAVVKT